MLKVVGTSPQPNRGNGLVLQAPARRAGLLSLVWDLPLSALRRTRQAWRRRAALSELGALDDRTLKDIGLHRGEIGFAADAYAREETYPGTAAKRAPLDVPPG